MPGRFYVTFYPFFDGGDIFFGVLQVFAYVAGLAACHEAVFGWLAGLSMDGPAAVLDAGRKMVGAAVGFGVLQVEIFGAGGRVVAKESVRSQLKDLRRGGSKESL